MRLAIDLCGTTHDAKEANYLTLVEFGERYGRVIESKESVFSIWTGHNWHDLMMSFGFSPLEAKEINRTYHDVFRKHEPSALIAGAHELFAQDPYIVTGARQHIVELRLRAQGLEGHLARTHAGQETKVPALLELSRGQPIAYAGDTEGDALAVAALRELGIDAFFIGLTHPYAFGAESVRAFCKAHSGFAYEARRLEDVPDIFRRL